MDIGENEEYPGDNKSDKVVCDVPGCYKKAVWQTEDGKQLCPVHLAELEAKELMY